MTEQQNQYLKVMERLEEIDNDDENLELLKTTAENWVANHDLCEGYKHAIRLCVDDQIQNHAEEMEKDELLKLLELLTPKK